MALDFSSLVKAIASLQHAIDRSFQDTGDEVIRDAVIQRFEYTYELCWKMLKRQLEAESPAPAEVDRMSFRELMREGAERGMIHDVESWLEYREQRNITSHAYDGTKAESVYKTAVDFIADARQLLLELERRPND